MVGTSSSSSSSCASFSSFDDVSEKSSGSSNSISVKFLCSYGGKILPRYPDGKLRYVGGETRVLSVDRSLPFSEVEAKMKEMCGSEFISVRCQLPTEDMDALVSVTSDEDLANLLEEYDVASRDQGRLLKIRAFMMPKTISPPSTPPVSATARITGKMPKQQHVYASRARPPANLRCVHQVAVANTAMVSRNACYGNYLPQQHHKQHHHQHHASHGEPRPHQYLVHHANLWQ